MSKILEEGQYTKTVCGTPHFKAPEIKQDGKHNHKADIFSLGLVFYTILHKNEKPAKI